jgi:RHS repeat-associated protein
LKSQKTLIPDGLVLGEAYRVATTSTGVHYRFGFNGKEHDSEAKGWQNQQDYGMRVYDPRIGRFLSVDPLLRNYPGWSPYPFAMNRVIDGIDVDGLEYMRYDKSYITLSVNYDRVTGNLHAIVSINRDNVTQATKNYIDDLSYVAGEPKVNWRSGEIGSRRSIVAEYYGPNYNNSTTNSVPVLKHSALKSQDDAEMQDVEKLPTAAAPQEADLPTSAKNKKEERERRRTRNFSFPVAGGQSPKGDLMLFTITTITQVLEARIGGNIQSDFEEAIRQSDLYVTKVLNQIYRHIKIGTIKEEDYQHLGAIANYLLNGQQPMHTFEFEGETYEGVDVKVLRLAQKVRDN